MRGVQGQEAEGRRERTGKKERMNELKGLFQIFIIVRVRKEDTIWVALALQLWEIRYSVIHTSGEGRFG